MHQIVLLTALTATSGLFGGGRCAGGRCYTNYAPTYACRPGTACSYQAYAPSYGCQPGTACSVPAYNAGPVYAPQQPAAPLPHPPPPPPPPPPQRPRRRPLQPSLPTTPPTTPPPPIPRRGVDARGAPATAVDRAAEARIYGQSGPLHDLGSRRVHPAWSQPAVCRRAPFCF